MGWDSREKLAYDVAAYSFKEQNGKKLQIIPLELANLPQLTRPIEWRGNQMWCPISDAPQTTEFSISRFLVPHLTNHKGWAMFMDCDVINTAPLEELFALTDDKYAVMVVKHNHIPTEDVHMVDQVQVKIPRKNWASMILFNCAHPSNKALTLDVINTWPGRDLHQFKWLQDEEIGELPQAWNYLVDVNEGNDIKIAHYTMGGPWINGWEPKDSDKLWNDTHKKLLSK